MDQRIVVDYECSGLRGPYLPMARRGKSCGRCLTGAARPLIGNALLLEYGDVLSRETLFATAPIGQEDRAALPDAVLGVCQWINISYLRRPNLGDESRQPSGRAGGCGGMRRGS